MGAFTPIIRAHLAAVAHEARGRMLDVGCGNKPYRELFPQVTEYIGMDRASPEVDDQRPDAAGRQAHYDVEGVADQIPFPDQRFDTILCTQVIEHIPDPRRFFAEAARVAAPGAVLIATAPLVNPVHEAPHDYYRYTNFGLTELCAGAGWQVERVTPMGGGLDVGGLPDAARAGAAVGAGAGPGRPPRVADPRGVVFLAVHAHRPARPAAGGPRGLPAGRPQAPGGRVGGRFIVRVRVGVVR
jgi:SAM-dependent methyltransferase